MRNFILGSLLLATWLVPSIARADEVPIVYSRCPRGAKPFTVTGPLVKAGVMTMATATVRNGDLLEMLPETARPVGNFVGPCDMVYRDGKGTERILYSCIADSTPEKSCAALDAAVSFDAKTVAFSVFRGPLERLRGTADGKAFDPAAENTATFYADLPGSHIMPTESQIVLVEIATGTQTPLPFPPGTINFGPAWLSNGRIAFSSTGRRPIYAPMPLCTNNSGTSIQLHAMDSDGRNVELVSPHALASELHPLQLTDGRVAVSSWQQFGMLAYRHGNSFGGCGTLPNFFHVYAQNPDGASANAIYGQHLSDPTADEYPLFGTHMAAHFFGQTTDGRLWTAEYYRANNLGLGAILGFPIPAKGQEGPNATEAAATKSSAFRAPDEVRLAPWASSSDQPAALMPDPPLTLPGYTDTIKYAGKLGHPSGLPGNQLMVTWGVGPCSLNTGAHDIIAMQNLEKETGDNPACDVGIYRTAALPANTPNIIKHPSELVEIVNSPDFHEFLARPVVPYKDIYGIDRPKDIPRAELAVDASLEHGTPFGVLGASSIIHRETKAAGAIAYEWNQPSLQGTDTIDYSDDELCGVRILAVHSNRKVESNWKSTSTVGERVSIVGEFPVRKWDAGGMPVMDPLGVPDTSFRVRFPADSPYLMQAIDCEGRTLNTDQTWQSLRPGEVKTCNGCHVHSSAATKLPFANTWAATGAAITYNLGAGKVPLLSGGSGQTVKTKEVDGYQYMIEFERDVMPILQMRCASCHNATRAEAGLRLDISRNWDNVQANKDDSTYARLALDDGQKFVPAALQRMGSHAATLGKPNLSKYVRMMNSRGSLLYWKARNARTDNRTDAQATDDVDFGAAHPSEITPDELAVMARWIDTGSGWGPEFTQDKVYPALHVVGVAAGSTVTALRIGTADVGDGIDPDSLTACVIPKLGDPCGPNLAGKAELAGVATVALAAPLADPDAEVWVTVKDRAGNMSEGRITVRFLLAQPPPPPSLSTPDGGPGPQGNPGGSGEPTAKEGGGCGCLVAAGGRTATGLSGTLGLVALLVVRARRPIRRRRVGRSRGRRRERAGRSLALATSAAISFALLGGPGCGGNENDGSTPQDAGPMGTGMAGTGGGGAGASGVGAGGAGNGGTGNGGAGDSDAGGGMAGAGGVKPVPDAGGIVPGPVDAIIAAMPAGSWKELPGTHMADLCPTPYSSYPCESVMTAWSGGAYDSLRDRLIVWGGGHSDSPYNNLFTFDVASMKWKRWTELPAGMTGDTTPAIFQDKRVETCGLYPKVATLNIPDALLTASGYVMPDKCDDPSIAAQLDPQQPRSAHTYGNVAFSAATGRFYVLGSIGTYPSGQSRTTLVLGFEFATSQWMRGANNPITDYGASAADGKGHLWYIAGQKLHEYDPVADKWTAHPSDGVGYYYAGSDVDTKRNILAMTANGASVSTYALSDAAKTQATITTNGLSTPIGGAAGLAYSPVLDRFVGYSGGRRIAVLDLQAAKWTELAGTGDDPGPQASNGTYGRFRYSPARDVFVVVNSTTKNVFLWKPPAKAP